MSVSKLPKSTVERTQEPNDLHLLASTAPDALKAFDRLTSLQDELQSLSKQVSVYRQELHELLATNLEPVGAWRDDSISLSLFKTGLFNHQGRAQVSCKLEFHPPLVAEAIYWTGFIEQSVLHRKNFPLVITLLRELIPHLDEDENGSDRLLPNDLERALPAIRSFYSASKNLGTLRERYYKGERLEVLRELDASDEPERLLNILDLQSEKLFWACEEILKLWKRLKTRGKLPSQDEALLERLLSKLLLADSE